MLALFDNQPRQYLCTPRCRAVEVSAGCRRSRQLTMIDELSTSTSTQSGPDPKPRRSESEPNLCPWCLIPPPGWIRPASTRKSLLRRRQHTYLDRTDEVADSISPSLALLSPSTYYPPTTQLTISACRAQSRDRTAVLAGKAAHLLWQRPQRQLNRDIATTSCNDHARPPPCRHDALRA